MTSRDRRALVIGIAFIGGLVVLLRGAPAWHRWRAQGQAAAEEALTDAARTGAAIASFQTVVDSLETRSARLVQLRPALLVGETPAEAAAMLAALVAETARSASVRLEAVETRLTTDSGALQRVGLTAQATADITGLASLLSDLEQGPTLIAVRRLSVRPQNPGTPSDQVEQLTIGLSVEGLALVRDRHIKAGP